MWTGQVCAGGGFRFGWNLFVHMIPLCPVVLDPYLSEYPFLLAFFTSLVLLAFLADSSA